MTNSDSPAASSLATRYGAPKRRLSKKAKIATAAVAAVLALAWILWTVFGGGPTVSQNVISYNASDPTLTTVELAVTKNPADTAQCAVQAMNSVFAVVGWKIVTVGPAEGAESGSGARTGGVRTTTVNVPVRTDSPAVTGVVDNCWILKR